MSAPQKRPIKRTQAPPETGGQPPVKKARPQARGEVLKALLAENEIKNETQFQSDVLNRLCNFCTDMEILFTYQIQRREELQLHTT